MKTAVYATGCIILLAWPFLAGMAARKSKAAASVIFVAGIVYSAALTLYYTHWQAYRYAVSHLDGQEILPIALGVICLILIIPTLVKVIRNRERKKHAVILAGLLVILAMCAYSAICTHGLECPACSSSNRDDNDVLYHFFYQLFTGKEWHPAE